MTMLILGYAITIFALVGGDSPKVKTKTYTMLEQTFVAPDAAKVHDSANRFAKEVGDMLKENYPSKVVNPTMKLELLTVDGAYMFRITWRCGIIPTTEKGADYYFDRRGTLLYGRTLSEARQAVEKQLRQSGKVAELHRSFPKGRMPISFVRISTAPNVDGKGVWLLKEYFLAAPR